MKKKVLVTGACGFTGSNMIERLAETGWDIVATDLKGSQRGRYYTESENSPNPVYYKDIMDQHDVEFIPADLTEPETLKKLFNEHEYDVVFNIASLFDYFADRDVLYEVNVEGVRNIAAMAAETMFLTLFSGVRSEF